MEAHDGDIGYAGLIRFGTFDKFFALEPFTGEVILLTSLIDLLKDKNKTKVEYVIQINACDWGQPTRCTNGTITILITEANVYKPRFEKVFKSFRAKPVNNRLICLNIQWAKKN